MGARWRKLVFICFVRSSKGTGNFHPHDPKLGDPLDNLELSEAPTESGVEVKQMLRLEI